MRKDSNPCGDDEWLFIRKALNIRRPSFEASKISLLPNVTHKTCQKWKSPRQVTFLSCQQKDHPQLLKNLLEKLVTLKQSFFEESSIFKDFARDWLKGSFLSMSRKKPLRMYHFGKESKCYHPLPLENKLAHLCPEERGADFCLT